jgi:hypothetical protein
LQDTRKNRKITSFSRDWTAKPRAPPRLAYGSLLLAKIAAIQTMGERGKRGNRERTSRAFRFASFLHRGRMNTVGFLARKRSGGCLVMVAAPLFLLAAACRGESG